MADGKLLDASRSLGLPVGTVVVLLVGALGAVTPGAIGLYRVTQLEAQLAAQQASASALSQAQDARTEKLTEQVQGLTVWRAVQEERYLQIIGGLNEVRDTLKQRTVYAKGRAE
jgi:hypothetical protein